MKLPHLTQQESDLLLAWKEQGDKACTFVKSKYRPARWSWEFRSIYSPHCYKTKAQALEHFHKFVAELEERSNQPVPHCCYCGVERTETSTRLPSAFGGSRTISNFGKSNIKGLDVCNACFALKYPTHKIPSTSISAAGIVHEHRLMKCGKSMVDTKPLKLKFEADLKSLEAA